MRIASLLYSFLLFFFGTCIAIEKDSLFEVNLHSNFLSPLCGGGSQSNWCQIGNRGFSTMNPAEWYDITTFAYPVTTPLSKNANFGSRQGTIQLTPRGIRVGQAGNYFVSFQVILTNNDEAYTPFIPIFLVRNDIFFPNDTSNLATVTSAPFGDIRAVTASGVLENVEAGTTLSIVATNGGSPQPATITIISWGISAFRIPCDPTPQ